MTGKSVVYSRAPTIPKLISLVAKKIPTKWYEIGMQLEIEIPTLEGFAADQWSSASLQQGI